MPATQIPPLSGRLAKASTILCVGEDAAGVARAAIGNVRQVHSSGDALRALACEDFVAVLLGPKMGQAAERLATAFARLIEFRPSPRWVVLKGPDDDEPQLPLPVLAIARGVTRMDPSEATAWLTHPEGATRCLANQRLYLDAHVLGRLENTEVECGEFLALAFDIFRRVSTRLVEQICRAARAGDTSAMKERAQALVAVSSDIGDLGTAAAAREILAYDGSMHEAKRRVESLPAALEVGLRSLALYLSADQVVD